MRYCLFLLCLFVVHASAAQTAKQAIRKMERVRFKHPIMVLVRLDAPVQNAEHTMIMEEAILPQLDTITLSGILHHPRIYFAKLYTSSVPGAPRRKYYMTSPELPEGLDPFKPVRFPYERLEKPSKVKLYVRTERAESYSHWHIQKKSSASGLGWTGYNGEINTLPGVDSVRVVYAVKIRARWKRGQSKNQVK